MARWQDGFKGRQDSVLQLNLSAAATAVSIPYSTGTQTITNQYISTKLRNILPE